MRVRRVIFPLLVLAAFLPSTALARTQFLCEVDLLVRDSCCCPPKKHKQPANVPAMRRECCKLVKHTATTLPPAAARADTAGPVTIAATVVATMVMAPARDARLAIAPRAQAPPPERSLFAQHCALLV